MLMLETKFARTIRSIFRTVSTLAVVCLLATGDIVFAEYPSRTITIIVPFPAGGTSDLQARMIAKGLTERLGKPVIVDNRPGAGGRIGADIAARSAPDGHTLMLASGSVLAIEPALRAHANYDPQRDFIPIALISEFPLVLIISPIVPATNLVELLAYARKHPGEITYGSWGIGTTNHLVTEQFKHLTNVDLLHVPYKGGAPAMGDIVSGHIAILFSLASDSLSQIKSGSVRALGTTSVKRLAVLPDVPTLAELGVHGIDLNHWYGMVVPVKTSPDIVNRLRAELGAVLKGAEFSRWAESQGAVSVAGTAEDLKKRIQLDMTSAAKIAQSISLKLED